MGGGGGRDEGVRGRILFGLNCPCLCPGLAEVEEVIGDQRGGLLQCKASDHHQKADR